jgi:hypothetical protein
MIRGDLDGAIERLGLARQVKTEIYGEDNISTARTLLLLAQAHMAAGDLAPVPELLETAGNSYVANYGADSRKMSFFELVTGQYRLAAGDIEGAREILHAAYEHRLEEYDPANILVLSPLFTLVSVELSAGDRAQAREWFEKTRPAVERLRETHAELIEAGVLEAELLAAEGRDAEALSTAAATLGLISEHFPARRDWIDRLTAISTRSGA